MTAASFDFTSVLRPGPRRRRPSGAVWPSSTSPAATTTPSSFPSTRSWPPPPPCSREGRTLATYGLESGPLGYLPLRRFLVEKLKRTAGIACTAEEILVTSGSLQALDLVNGALLASGDTVLIEQESYQGSLNRLTRLGVNALGIPLDRDGMRVEAAAAALADLKRRGIHAKYIYTIPTVQIRPPPSCRSSDGSSS